MYKEFYKLQRNPFEITPDPSFLYLTRRHKEALAALYHGVRRRKGFVVLTGEVGTGKTLLIRCLLQLLSGSEVKYAYVFNTRISALEFLQYIATDLGLSVWGKSKAQVLHELSSYVVARYQKNLTTLIVIDEAHHLTTEILEEVRLLTNLETAQQKLAQILLVGQPELAEKLDSFELRQLKQRVALRCHLEPLRLDETIGYVRRRLQLAGAANYGNALLPDATIAKIHRRAAGIPRVINTICENALITAFARQLPQVNTAIVQEVAKDLCLGVTISPQIQATAGNEELLQAMRTLLELHDRLRGTREVQRTSLDPELDRAVSQVSR